MPAINCAYARKNPVNMPARKPQIREAYCHECRSGLHFINREYAGSANSESQNRGVRQYGKIFKKVVDGL